MNLNVVYQGPVPCLSVLTAELTATFGKPARPYEYVTGYDRTGITSHNADVNGRAHAVDIFVGPGNLTEAQGIWVAEQLRREGERGIIPGHPDRLAYIIHRGRIAGDHTNWQWIPYTGTDWHGDHIHVSASFDYYWGDPVVSIHWDYNNTSPWNLGSPITTPEADMPLTDADVDKILNAPIPRRGGRGGTTTLKSTLAFLDANLDSIPNNVWAQPVKRGGKLVPALQDLASGRTAAEQASAKITALESVVKQLLENQGGTVDYTKVTEAVRAGLEEGIVTVDVTFKGASE